VIFGSLRFKCARFTRNFLPGVIGLQSCINAVHTQRIIQTFSVALQTSYQVQKLVRQRYL